MKVIVGLGNPGEKYESNRHNAGFVILDKFQDMITNFQFSNSKQNSKFQYIKKLEAEVWKGDGVVLVKPWTFMNRSGEAVGKTLRYFGDDKFQNSLHYGGQANDKYESLYVVHDDLDISLGEYKVDFGKGPKVHGGVNSVEEVLGTKEFWRVRIGIENRSREERVKIPGERYVLGGFLEDEREVIDKVMDEVVGEMGKIINNQ